MKKLLGMIIRVIFSCFFHSLLFILTFELHFKDVSSYKLKSKSICNYLSNQIARTHYFCKTLTENIFDLSSESARVSTKQTLVSIDVNNMKVSDFKWRSDYLNLDTVKKVAEQLGYVPLNIINIGVFLEDSRLALEIFPLEAENESMKSLSTLESVSSSYAQVHKRPLVVIVYPLNCNSFNRQHKSSKVLKPFPTVIWMTCPELHTKISKLEDAGWISKLQTKLQESNEYKEKMILAHESYKQFRWNLLSKDDQDYLNESGWRPSLNEVGIAGMKNYDSVKCLHTHYAHYLCRPQDGNIIGEWTHELLVQSQTWKTT